MLEGRARREGKRGMRLACGGESSPLCLGSLDPKLSAEEEAISESKTSNGVGVNIDAADVTKQNYWHFCQNSNKPFPKEERREMLKKGF